MSKAQLSPSQWSRRDKSVSKFRQGPRCYQCIGTAAEETAPDNSVQVIFFMIVYSPILDEKEIK